MKSLFKLSTLKYDNAVLPFCTLSLSLLFLFYALPCHPVLTLPHLTLPYLTSPYLLLLLLLIHLPFFLILLLLLHLSLYPMFSCFVTVLMKKDLRLAVDAAESRNIPVPTGRQALSTYSHLCETGLSHKDFSVIYQHLSKTK